MDDTAIWTGKIVETGHRIAKLLQSDVETYALGEVRRRFVESPQVADALDDDDVARLKAGARAFAAEAAARIDEALGDDAVWLGAEPPEGEATIESIPTVHEALADVADGLTRFLAEHGLPADEPLAYRLPARFIDGENLATLTRNLWKAVARYRAALDHKAETRATSSRDARARRWDDA